MPFAAAGTNDLFVIWWCIIMDSKTAKISVCEIYDVYVQYMNHTHMFTLQVSKFLHTIYVHMYATNTHTHARTHTHTHSTHTHILVFAIWCKSWTFEKYTQIHRRTRTRLQTPKKWACLTLYTWESWTLRTSLGGPQFVCEI